MSKAQEEVAYLVTLCPKCQGQNTAWFDGDHTCLWCEDCKQTHVVGSKAPTCAVAKISARQTHTTDPRQAKPL